MQKDCPACLPGGAFFYNAIPATGWLTRVMPLLFLIRINGLCSARFLRRGMVLQAPIACVDVDSGVALCRKGGFAPKRGRSGYFGFSDFYL